MDFIDEISSDPYPYHQHVIGLLKIPTPLLHRFGDGFALSFHAQRLDRYKKFFPSPVHELLIQFFPELIRYSVREKVESIISIQLDGVVLKAFLLSIECAPHRVFTTFYGIKHVVFEVINRPLGTGKNKLTSSSVV